MKKLKKWMGSNSTSARLTRTIVQGILSVLAANIDFLIESLHFSGSQKALIVAICMAILSPIMSELRGTEEVVSNG